MFVWYADSVKKEARTIYSSVFEKGCKACPLREQCNEVPNRRCFKRILRELQAQYDYRVDLQQNYGIY